MLWKKKKKQKKTTFIFYTYYSEPHRPLLLNEPNHILHGSHVSQVQCSKTGGVSLMVTDHPAGQYH